MLLLSSPSFIFCTTNRAFPLKLTLSTLRKIALIEGATLILLVLIAVPLKHLAGIPQMVSIVGPIHGFAFLAYFGVLTLAQSDKLISVKEWVIGFIAAFIPFGSFIFEQKILKGKE